MLLVLLLIGFVSCIAVLGSSGGRSGSKSPSSEPEASKDEAQSAVAIGESVNVGDVTWRVTDAKKANQLIQPGVSKQFAKTEQGNFVVVDFDFINNGSEPVTLATQSLTLIDSDGRESNPQPDQFFYVPQEKQIFLENMNPGITKHGETIFEVAPGASGFQLEVGDTNLFSDENGYVDLGF